MKTRILASVAVTLLLLVAQVSLPVSAHAQYTVPFQTNTISGVASNWVSGSGYIVGNNTFADALIIQSGGALSNGTGYLGNLTSASNNSATVTGIGSVWSNNSLLYVGNSGAGNQLVVNSGGKVFNGAGYLGFNTGSSNNVAVISGTGSVWSNGGNLYIGNTEGGNQLIVTNGGAVFSGVGFMGNSASSSNNLTLVSGTGSVWTANSTLYVGSVGAGNRLIVTNGGVVMSLSGALGNNVSSSNNVTLISGTGSVWSAGSTLYVGVTGAGNQLTVTNGGVVVNVNGSLGINPSSGNNVAVVSGAGSVWTNIINLVIGESGASNQLIVTNGGMVISGTFGILGDNPSGSNNVALISGTGSVWKVGSTFYIGPAGGGNQLIVSNGGMAVSSSMIIGNFSCATTSIVNVAGGELDVTNAAGNAVLEVRSGTLILSGGLLRADKIVITNSCAHFVRTGGTLIYGTAVLNPNDDTDGDGIPNGYEQSHGLDPLNPADASADNDGDGFSNLQEYLAGTDPNSARSTPFRVTSIAEQGNNIILTWTTSGGTTNQVQVTNGGSSGIYSSNSFANLGTQMIIGGSGLITTNFTDGGGATNLPARYYRVQLVP